jgi:hypothetical protein
MATLVRKSLENLLQNILVNYSKENVTFHVLKATGDLKELEFKPHVVQYYLKIPGKFRVTRAYCNQARLKVRSSLSVSH